MSDQQSELHNNIIELRKKLNLSHVTALMLTYIVNNNPCCESNLELAKRLGISISAVKRCTRELVLYELVESIRNKTINGQEQAATKQLAPGALDRINEAGIAALVQS